MARCTLILFAATALGEPDPTLRIDVDTGRDLKNYAPHRFADFHHMRLEIDIPDMNVPTFDARSVLTLEPIAEDLWELPLDAHRMEIRSVSMNGAPAVLWTHDGEELLLRFEPPIPVGRRIDVQIEYAVDDPARGLIWTLESPEWPGRPPQIHTQGQAETNSYWFPCHDFPNERLTTELIVTVPPGYIVSSNGRLVERREEGTSGGVGVVRSRGRETWHWLQAQEHPHYLVSLVVGRFDVVDVSPAGERTGQRPVPLEMPVYVPPGRASDVEATYGRTAEMARVFEALFDEPYPWDRYAQVVVWNFMAGGMENTAATTMYDTAVLDETAQLDFSLEGLIAHELAHQWYGDLITCKTWEHLWLNEGFATFCEALWFEHRDGFTGYQREIVNNFDSLIGSDDANAPMQPAMVSKVYLDPDHVFDRKSDTYSKGASALHMLRTKLGDDVFFRALHAYTDRFRQESVETSDLRQTFEEVSGETLERFFDQWCLRPGIPVLDVHVEWDDGDKALRIDVEQVQNIDDRNPAFAFELPVWIAERRNGTGREERLFMEERSGSLVVPMSREPAAVAIDPRLTVLCELRVSQPVERWLVQLEAGPTPAARAQAIRHLGKAGSEEAIAALQRTARHAGADEWIRLEAVEALAEAEAPAVLLASVDDQNPHVRRVAIESLASLVGDWTQDENPRADTWRADAADAFSHAFQADPSYRVRAAAVEGLGQIGAEDRLDVVLAALEEDSQHDVIRRGALRALRDLDVSVGLEQAIRFSLPGTLGRTRGLALEVVGDLAAHDEQAALAALEAGLRDREERAHIESGESLARIGGDAALEILERRAGEMKDAWWRERLLTWAAEARHARIESGG